MITIYNIIKKIILLNIERNLEIKKYGKIFSKLNINLKNNIFIWKIITKLIILKFLSMRKTCKKSTNKKWE